MDAERFFAGTRVFAKEGEHYYFIGDQNMTIVPSTRPGYQNQCGFRVIAKTEDGLKARDFVVSMSMGASINSIFKTTNWTGWIKAVKKKNAKGRIAWQAEKIDREPIDPGKVSELVTELEALGVARNGTDDVSGSDEDLPF